MAKLDRPALEAAGPEVRLVFQPAVDVSRISMPECAARGVAVCNAPGSNANGNPAAASGAQLWGQR